MSAALFCASAGSYEGSIFGWEVKPVADSKDDGEIEDLEASLAFGFHTSVGAIRAIANSGSGRYLVVGGTDEVIRVFNMVTKKSAGELSATHTGTITCLQFYEDSFLLSGSEDNNICIWRIQDWECLHILGGHKDIIHDLSIHPSGKLAISVSKDNTMKLWNLVEGRMAFTRRLKGAADQVLWNSTGDFYLLVVRDEVQVYQASTNECVNKIKCNSRVNRACFAPPGQEGGYCIISVCDNKSFIVFDSSKNLGDATKSFKMITLPDTAGRPKSVKYVQGSDGKGYAVIITSSGAMMALDDGIFQSDTDFDDVFCASFSLDIEPRLTCLTAWNPAAKMTKNNYKTKGSQKRKAGLGAAVECEDDIIVDDDDEEEEEEEEEEKGKKKGKKGKAKAVKAQEEPVKKSKKAKGSEKKKESERKKVSFGGQTSVVKMVNKKKKH